MKLEISAKPTAERLIGLCTRAPVVQLTGAEIAVLLGLLDDLDTFCVHVLNKILGIEATEKRYLETIKTILEMDFRLSRTKAYKIAEIVLSRLRELGIVTKDYVKKVLRIPNKHHSTIVVKKDESFFLFAGTDLKKWIGPDLESIRISGVALGYAYCKCLAVPSSKLALDIARELSSEKPLLPLKEWHFECIGPKKVEICQECLKGQKKWIQTSKLAVAVYKLSRTETGKAAVYMLRVKKCVFGSEDDEKKLRTMKNYTLRNAERMLSKVALMPFEISRLPVVMDDSSNFINYPQLVIKNGRVCGLALRIAYDWYFSTSYSDQYRKDELGVDALLRALMNLRHTITPDFKGALKILAERVKYRNHMLSELGRR